MLEAEKYLSLVNYCWKTGRLSRVKLGSGTSTSDGQSRALTTSWPPGDKALGKPFHMESTYYGVSSYDGEIGPRYNGL